MAYFLCVLPQSLLVSPITNINRTTTRASNNHSLSSSSHFGFSNNKTLFGHRGSVGGVRFAFRPPSSLSDLDLDGMQSLAHDVFTRTEALLYTLADAAVSASSDTTTVVEGVAKESGDWLSGITNLMETVLKVLKDGPSTLHVPYGYGFAIILLTILIKAATFPLTKKQISSFCEFTL